MINLTCFEVCPQLRRTETIRWTKFMCTFLLRRSMEAQRPITAVSAERLLFLFQLRCLLKFVDLANPRLIRCLTSTHPSKIESNVGACTLNSSTMFSHLKLIIVWGEAFRRMQSVFFEHITVISFWMSDPTTPRIWSLMRLCCITCLAIDLWFFRPMLLVTVFNPERRVIVCVCCFPLDLFTTICT